MSELLAGKRLLITGIITDASIAFSVAKIAQENGATVVLTGYGRMSLVERIAKRLPSPAPVIELDATDPDQLAALADKVREHVDGLDGVVHSIGYAPPSCPVMSVGPRILGCGSGDWASHGRDCGSGRCDGPDVG